MPAAKKPIYIEQGATFVWTIELKNGNGATSPVLDLTGHAARMQIREELGSAAPLISLTSAVGGGLTITPLAGRIEVKISDEQTALLNFETAVYDFELEQPNGDVLRLFQGAVTLSPEVTRL